MQLTVQRTWDDQPVEASRRVAVRVRAVAGGLELRCRARLWSAQVHPHPPGPTPGLWESEVVEWFFGGADGRYTEVEVGPFGNHLVLRFDGYRRKRDELLPMACSARIDSTASGRSWSGRAVLPWALLPEGPLRMNVCAIQPGPIYLQWSPACGERPDFHVTRGWRPLAVTPVDV